MTEKKRKLFGTDGIRAKAGEFPLDSKTVRTIGHSLARHLTERTKSRQPLIVIGRDTRESGPTIERDLIAGARAAGAAVQSAGVITTPGVAFLARSLPADAGVVISASHNPFEDNGIKIFESSGRKLDDATEQQIESDVSAYQKPDREGEQRWHTSPREEIFEDAASGSQVPDEQRAVELRNRYIDHLEREIGSGLSLSDVTIAVDCANGASSGIAPKLFRDLGAHVIAINDEPNGRNINLNCGSLHIESLQARVVAESANIGVAFDGDADRALFVDSEGNFVDGDATMWALANYMQGRGELAANVVVATVMTNLGLEVALRDRGIRLVRTDVGDKYVLDELLRSKASLGGEQSGHIIFPRVSLAGDGIITALNLLRVMRDENSSLADLTREFVHYPQILVNVRVREKVPFDEVPSIARKARQIEGELGDRGRLLLRYSGTEALARVMIEGEDEKQVNHLANGLADVIRSELGVTVATP